MENVLKKIILDSRIGSGYSPIHWMVSFMLESGSSQTEGVVWCEKTHLGI